VTEKIAEEPKLNPRTLRTRTELCCDGHSWVQQWRYVPRAGLIGMFEVFGRTRPQNSRGPQFWTLKIPYQLNCQFERLWCWDYGANMQILMLRTCSLQPTNAFASIQCSKMRLRPGLGPRCRGAYSVPQTSYLVLRGPIRGGEGEEVKGKRRKKKGGTGAWEV